MKNNLIAALIPLFAIPTLAAQSKGGGGGNSILCYSSVGSTQVQSIELFDYWEQPIELNSLGLRLDIGPVTWPLDKKIDYIMDRLTQFDPVRAERYRNRAKEIIANLDTYLAETDLRDLNDDFPRAIPRPPCYKTPLAIQVVNPMEGQNKFLINKSIFNHPLADNNLRTGIILHEMIYQEAIDHGQTDSRTTRYYNFIISSNLLKDFNGDTLERYNKVLSSIDLPLMPPRKVELFGQEVWLTGYNTRDLLFKAVIRGSNFNFVIEPGVHYFSKSGDEFWFGVKNQESYYILADGTKFIVSGVLVKKDKVKAIVVETKLNSIKLGQLTISPLPDPKNSLMEIGLENDKMTYIANNTWGMVNASNGYESFARIKSFEKLDLRDISSGKINFDLTFTNGESKYAKFKINIGGQDLISSNEETNIYSLDGYADFLVLNLSTPMTLPTVGGKQFSFKGLVYINFDGQVLMGTPANHTEMIRFTPSSSMVLKTFKLNDPKAKHKGKAYPIYLSSQSSRTLSTTCKALGYEYAGESREIKSKEWVFKKDALWFDGDNEANLSSSKQYISEMTCLKFVPVTVEQ